MKTEQMTQEQKKAHEQGCELAKNLCNVVSAMGNGKSFIQGFTEEFCNNQHRTLQQEAGVTIYALLKFAAEKYKRKEYDLRNEDFYKFASKVIEYCPDEYFPFI